MADDFTTERLEVTLASIGRHLEIPPEPTGPMALGRPRRWRPTGRLLVAAVVLVIAAAGVAIFFPSARAAVADLFGIGSTRIEITDQDPVDGAHDGAFDGAHDGVGGGVVDGPELPHVAEGLPRVSADEAAGLLGGELPDTSGTTLGPPEAIDRMPEGGVLLAWRDDTVTLWVRATTEPTTGPGIVLRKLIGAGADVESVDGLGTEALIITDAHLLQTPQRRLAAQRVLLWYDDDHEYRFEADLAPADLIAIARGLR